MAGREERDGISLVQLFDMFPNDDDAQAWFEEVRWPDGRACPRCGSTITSSVPEAKPMPYWCSDCRKYFSVKIGTVMESSRMGLQKWAIAIYQMMTNLKGVSSMKLARDLGIQQKSAWFMMHRIREAMGSDDPMFLGPVEADETYVGGRARNMHASRRRGRGLGRGVEALTAVAGIRDRYSHQVSAAPIPDASSATLHRFVESRTHEDAVVYSDEWGGYRGIARVHETVNHSAGEYVRDMVSTNGMESFWAQMKRGHIGIYHWFSKKHLHRYVVEFQHRHNWRPMDTIDQMINLVVGMMGKRLKYSVLIGDEPPLNTQMAML